MKTHKTTNLDTSLEFQRRFLGTQAAARKATTNLRLGTKRTSQFGKWSHALILWNKVKSGAINGRAAEAVRRDHAGKFSQFDKNGGRLPLGV